MFVSFWNLTGRQIVKSPDEKYLIGQSMDNKIIAYEARWYPRKGSIVLGLFHCSNKFMYINMGSVLKWAAKFQSALWELQQTNAPLFLGWNSLTATSSFLFLVTRLCSRRSTLQHALTHSWVPQEKKGTVGQLFLKNTKEFSCLFGKRSFLWIFSETGITMTGLPTWEAFGRFKFIARKTFKARDGCNSAWMIGMGRLW